MVIWQWPTFKANYIWISDSIPIYGKLLSNMGNITAVRGKGT